RRFPFARSETEPSPRCKLTPLGLVGWASPHGGRIMSKRAVLCTAISMAALAVGLPMEASAATVTRTTTTTVRRSAPRVAPRVTTTPKVNTTVRTNTRVNTGNLNRTTTTRTTTTTQFKKLNTGGTGAGTGANAAKFHKPLNNPNTAHITPTTLKPLHGTNTLKLGPGKINPAITKVNFAGVHLANNKFGPLWKQKHGLWWGGKWKYFVP